VDLGTSGKWQSFTGRSEGIGYATARLLSEKSAAVAICSSGGRDRLGGPRNSRRKQMAGSLATADMSSLDDIPRSLPPWTATLAGLTSSSTAPAHPSSPRSLTFPMSDG